MGNADHERIFREWHAAFTRRDADALAALYGPDATLEGPIVPTVMRQDAGVVRGRDRIAAFIGASFAMMSGAQGGPCPEPKPSVELWRPDHPFSRGDTLMWEHPRETPDGEQMDVVHAMDVRNGLIRRHRTYWGWRSVQSALPMLRP